MNPSNTLSRREALARLGVLLGGALIGGDTWLRGGSLPGKAPEPAFTSADIALLDEIGETIIPTTNTPGAKAAGIGAFMAMMVTDCYDSAQHVAFQAGLEQLRREGFLQATPADRTARLNALDAESRQQRTGRAASGPAHFFKMMKQLTILGYCTSEIGATQVFEFTEVPGRLDGNVPYKKGDRIPWTPPSRSL
jgi:hypothetical protein